MDLFTCLSTIRSPRSARCERLDVMAHSMGNIVVCEALRASNGPVVDNYYACNSAEVGHAVYPDAAQHVYPVQVSVIGFPLVSISEQDAVSEYPGPNLYRNATLAGVHVNSEASLGTHYHDGIGQKAKIVNFYNDNDAALDIWGPNQLLKVDVGYAYSFTMTNDVYGFDQFFKSGGLFVSDKELFWPTDSASILPYIVQGRSKAMGRLNSGGGEISTSNRLSDLIPNIESEHSGIMNFPLYETHAIWETVAK